MMMRISMDPADMSRPGMCHVREDDLGRASIVLARREIEWTAAWAAKGETMGERWHTTY
ncbi:uncharacterized protein SCHCODRAFT_01098759 [Schizophyllum commune H4-8]|uniref:uncharacterized protein n=1 Tax=Schizophyllum commune (strain H4-8 / FGSC 9210) TaxID=578458 RepID=UPI00215F4937|nr:uncharacterized protein SCHCODRAFT_01098759 [Schizophyllum commune H4-8]KAI5889981.1 hypothetical protein SCHCODRAFT_01098759 [Schizophyllum commune H4-8]